MRILNEQDQEISIEEADLTLGYLQNESMFVKHLDEQKHYIVKQIFFDDRSSYTPTQENDPRIEIIDATLGKFNYLAPEGEEKKVRGMDIGFIVDQTAQDVYEDIQRYILYTQEELIQRGLPDRIASLEQSATTLNNSIELTNSDLSVLQEDISTTTDSINNLQNDLDDLNLGVEDLILLFAEILGGEEEEIEEEPEEEVIEEEVIEENVEVEKVEEESIEESEETINKSEEEFEEEIAEEE